MVMPDTVLPFGVMFYAPTAVMNLVIVKVPIASIGVGNTAGAIGVIAVIPSRSMDVARPGLKIANLDVTAATLDQVSGLCLRRTRTSRTGCSRGTIKHVFNLAVTGTLTVIGRRIPSAGPI